MALKKKTQAVEVKTDDNAVVTTASIAAPIAKAVDPVIAQEIEPASVEVEELEVEEVEVVGLAENVIVKASATESKAVAPGGSNFQKQSADEGFEGLELGYFSFPTVKLPGEGVFETSTGQTLGKEFDVVVTGSKAKFLIKPAGADSKDKRIAYSYDQVTTTDGKTMHDLKVEWNTTALEIKKYLDVPAKLVRAAGSSELDGTMVMLSIPPSGIQRFSGYIAELQFLGKGTASTVVTKCKVGPKVAADNDFYPWLFEFVSKA